MILLRRQEGRRASEIASLIVANLQAVADDLASGAIVVLDEDRARDSEPAAAARGLADRRKVRRRISEARRPVKEPLQRRLRGGLQPHRPVEDGHVRFPANSSDRCRGVRVTSGERPPFGRGRLVIMGRSIWAGTGHARTGVNRIECRRAIPFPARRRRSEQCLTTRASLSRRQRAPTTDMNCGWCILASGPHSRSAEKER